VKRVIGLVFICGAASFVPAEAAPAPPAPHASAAARPRASSPAARQAAVLLLAPADEYFGPLKLSILGIRNTIHDLGARYDVNHEIAHQTYTSAQLTERAIHDWEHRYPRDGQVPKAIYLLQRLYTKVLSEESRRSATATARWMFADYPSSPQGKQLKKTLAVQHLAPLPVPSAAPVEAPAPADTPPPEEPPGTNSTTPATPATPATDGR
jgi:hypothetical protein